MLLGPGRCVKPKARLGKAYHRADLRVEWEVGRVEQQRVRRAQQWCDLPPGVGFVPPKQPIPFGLDLFAGCGLVPLLPQAAASPDFG